MMDKPPSLPGIDPGISRVVVTGAESTGKTTLARRLARHYATVWAPEYLRVFVEQEKAAPEEGDAWSIARGHLAQERKLAHRARRVLFLDTDLILTCIYQAFYFGSCPDWLSKASAERAADLYLVANTDIPWMEDPGQRDGPHVRAAVHTRLVEELRRRNLPFRLVSGTIEQRLQQAARAVDRLLDR